MAPKPKAKTGELDTSENVQETVEQQENPQTSQQEMFEQMKRMADLLSKSQDRIAQLETENRRSKDSSEKKDNTKPKPINPRTFALYVKDLKIKKPNVFNKKFDELVEKGKKFGVTVTPIETNDFEDDNFSLTV
jgi:acyl-CoA reductase-like NAD-dependent aldehyde dehydrogenase